MTFTEIQRMANGRFHKVAETENSIVVGTFGGLNEINTTNEIVEYIANFYGINTQHDKFRWHLVTADGAKNRGCELPTSNYNEFIEFFKFSDSCPGGW